MIDDSVAFSTKHSPLPKDNQKKILYCYKKSIWQGKYSRNIGIHSLSLPSISDTMLHLAREGSYMHIDTPSVPPIFPHILSVSNLSKPPHN